MLSHGQASVERGFSINSEIMEYNFTQKSIVALRNIYDHIQTCKECLFRILPSAEEATGRKKNEEKHEANWVVGDEISSLKVKRKCLLEHCSVLQDS